jgi:hypothetical protein
MHCNATAIMIGRMQETRIRTTIASRLVDALVMAEKTVVRMMTTIIIVRIIVGVVVMLGKKAGCYGCGRSCCSCSRCGAVDITARVLLFPFGSPVLEPDFHLGLGQAERQGQVESFAHGQVSGLFEFVLERYQLFVGESGASSTRLGPPLVIIIIIFVIQVFVIVIYLIHHVTISFWVICHVFFFGIFFGDMSIFDRVCVRVVFVFFVCFV